MIDDELTAAVEEALRKAAAEEIMPRWRALASHEVHEKTGEHDLVTVADHRAEHLLATALTELLPGSVVVGEEEVHDSPVSYERLLGEAPVWIIDPIDGTRQFVHHDPGFCTLVALAQRGELLASFTYAPALDQLAVARRGRGAVLGGTALRCGSPGEGGPLRVATSHPDFTTEEQQRALRGLNAPGVAARPCGAAGLEYLGLARGTVDAVVFSWESAWDHAAGLLLVAEAGGAHATVEGMPFRLAGGNALPFTAARDDVTVRRILSLLAAAGPGAA